MQIDLHTHSMASDGSLSPADLISRALEYGVNVLALTDHDGIDGLDEARHAAENTGLHFINGIELSVTWNKRTVHIVGLNFAADSLPLQAGIKRLREFRELRAKEISSKLEKAGIQGAYDGARCFSGGKMLGRMHFAKFLAASGHAKDIRQVFKRYLVNNKPGHVRGEWATLQETVGWITDAGGIAVIAHPARYNLTRSKLRKLISDFVAAGGQGIEVISGSHNVNEMKTMACHANDFDLYASSGSDFHDPDFPWNRLGKLPDLPFKCKPVWDLFL